MKKIWLAGMIAIWATGAMAHSPLDETRPESGTVVGEMPSEILMNFKGDIRLTRVTITHAEKHSMDMDLGAQNTFMQEFALPMHDMGAGGYTVEWRGLGADGHVLSGSFSFSVE